MKAEGRSRRDKILERLREMKRPRDHHDRDPVSDHTKADELLLKLIADPEITRAFNDIDKWYA